MNFSRRQFIRSAAVSAVVAPNIIPSSAWAAKPSNKINLGFIGFGRMNQSHLNFFLGQADCRVIAIAEVAKIRLDEAIKRVAGKYGVNHGCKAHNDFRDVLGNKSVDAVVIGTPDHWHAMTAIMAADAKKDVYCEKPLTVTVRAARETLKAARRNNIVFQVGSQQRTEYGGRFRQAVECVRNGRIGEVNKVKIGVGSPAVSCDLPTEPKADGIDCIRSRKKPVADVSYGAHTSIVCSLANIGYHVRKELQWDPKSYSCNRKLGNVLANRSGRGEWKYT